MPTPRDKALYERVKKRIYKQYKTHGAYRSAALVKEYKKAYGRKYGPKASPYIGKKNTKKGIARWMREKWTDQYGKPYASKPNSVFRPSKKITKKTPITWKQLNKRQVRSAIKEKQKTGRVSRFRK